MNEQEYVSVLNLAKIQVLAEVLYTMIPDDNISGEELSKVRKIVSNWLIKQHSAINLDPVGLGGATISITNADE